MMLKNKRTGEIEKPRIAYQEIYIDTKNRMTYCYKSLDGVFKEWEVYEEPEKYFWIDVDGFIASNDVSIKDVASETFKQNLKSIGNYFETREEAEQARKKLKAWKRLKNKGFRFDGWEDLQAKMGIDDLLLFNRDVLDADNVIGFRMDDYHDCIKDLNICFGGKDGV